MRSIVDKTFKVLDKILTVTLLFLMILLPSMVVIQVVLRYVLKTSLFGIEELMLIPIIWLFMLGGVRASQKKEHIFVGILNLYVKDKKVMHIFEIVNSAITVIISSWLTYWSLWFFIYSLTKWKLSNLLQFPMFLGESAIGIAMVLITIVELYHLVNMLINVKEHRGV